MARGHGPWKHVAKDGTVSWRIRVELPPDPFTGARRRGQRTYRTRTEAQGGLREWLAEIDAGTVVLDSRIMLGDFLQLWLAAVKPRIEPRTYQGYEQICRVHLIPALGHLRLQSLDRVHAEGLYAKLLADGGRQDGRPGPLSRRYCRMVHDILKRACTEAVGMRLLRHNPLAEVKPPKPLRNHRFSVWTADEVAAFLATVGEHDHYGALWDVALHTGLRVGELLGLRWEDCQLEGKTPELRVRQVLQDLHGALSLKPVPKSDSGTRAVALSPTTVTVLARHQECQAARRARHDGYWEYPELVFVSSAGTFIQPRNLTRHFALLTARAGVKRLRIHDLRHTHATLLMLAGVNPKIVSERLGHNDVAFTLRIYSHVLPQMQTDAAATFDTLIQDASKKRPATSGPLPRDEDGE